MNFRIVVGFSCLLITVVPGVLAQGSRASTVAAGVQGDIRSREWALMHIPDEVNKHFKKEQVSLFDQVRDDFTHIQLIDNHMMQKVFVQNILDEKFIASSVSEIRKRATRLRENLDLPRVNHSNKRDKTEPAVQTDLTRTRLNSLDQSITSFVGNPLFKEPKVIDSKLAEQAGLDLDRIIRLSEGFKLNRGSMK